MPALSTAILAQDLVNDRSRFAFCWRTYCWASTIPSFLISVAGWNVRALPVTKDPVTPYLSVKHVKLQRSKVHTAPRLLVRVHGFAFALLQAGEPSALDGTDGYPSAPTKPSCCPRPLQDSPRSPPSRLCAELRKQRRCCGSGGHPEAAPGIREPGKKRGRRKGINTYIHIYIYIFIYMYINIHITISNYI